MIPATLIWRNGTREDAAVEQAPDGPTTHALVRRGGRVTTFRRVGMERSRFLYVERESRDLGVAS